MAQRATQKSNPVIVEEPLKDKPFERQKPLITIISGTRNRTDLTRPDIEQPAEVFPAQQAQPTVSSLTAYPFLHARRMTQQPSPRTVSMSMPEKVINHTCKNTNRTAVGPPPRRVDRRWFKKHMNPSSLPGPSRKIISRDALSHL